MNGMWRRSTRSLRSFGRTSVGTWLAARATSAGNSSLTSAQARIFSTSVRGSSGSPSVLQHRDLHGVLRVLG